jgi:hypothetical protein
MDNRKTKSYGRDEGGEPLALCDGGGGGGVGAETEVVSK